MSEMDRHDVYNRDDIVCLVEDLGRDLAVDDLGEDCAHGSSSIDVEESRQKNITKKAEKEFSVFDSVRSYSTGTVMVKLIDAHPAKKSGEFKGKNLYILKIR